MSNPDQPTEASEAPPTPGSEIRPTSVSQTPQPQIPQPQQTNETSRKALARTPLIVTGVVIALFAGVYFLLGDGPVPLFGLGHDDIVKYTEKTYEKISVPTSWQQYSKGENADPVDIGAADTGWTYSYSVGAGTDKANYEDLQRALAANDGAYTFDTLGSPKVLVASSEKQNLKLTATFKGQSVDVEVRELHVDE